MSLVLVWAISLTGAMQNFLIAAEAEDAVNGSACSKLCINNQCESTCVPVFDQRVETGSGDFVSKSFVTSDEFQEVKLIGLDAVITQAESFSIKATGQANILDKIQLEVEAGKLLLSLKSGAYQGAEVVVNITLPKLLALSANGSNHLVIQGFIKPEMVVQLTGANSLIGHQNTIHHLSINAQGSNQVDWLDNNVHHLSVDMQGANTMSVNFRKNQDNLIDGQLQGLNQISLCGEPTSKLLVNGLSSLNNIQC